MRIAWWLNPNIADEGGGHQGRSKLEGVFQDFLTFGATATRC